MVQDCSYTQREDGIHQFVFFAPSRTAVDFWIETIDKIRAKDGTVGLMLMDLRTFAPQAMYYMLKSFREWRGQYPKGTGSCTAVVFPDQEHFLSAARTFSQLMVSGRVSSVQLYKRSEYQDAVDWLRDNKIKI